MIGKTHITDTDLNWNGEPLIALAVAAVAFASLPRHGEGSLGQFHSLALWKMMVDSLKLNSEIYPLENGGLLAGI